MKTIITLLAILMITGCGGITDNRPMNTLPDVLQVGQSILSRDTVKQTEYPILNEDQRNLLSRLMALEVPKGTQFIGRRPAGEGLTLEAYKVPTGEDPNQFKVYLITLDKKDVMLDYLDLREFHTSEHQGPMRFGGNRFYTTDASITFDNPTHFSLHRVMTLTSLYLKDHTLTECWRVEWDNHFEIDGNGHYIFKDQQETTRIPNDVDDPIIEEYKSRDRQLPK